MLVRSAFADLAVLEYDDEVDVGQVAQCIRNENSCLK